MQFILTGFTQETGFRVFAFEGIGAERTRMEFTVKTDLELIRKYGIRVQELPLLCRRLLEREEAAEQKHNCIFTEQEMRVYANNCVAERDAEKKQKAMRRAATAQDR